ncbi:hypothetical protein [Micromonospora yangpuensis]|uniref:Uncharacterized protein n=1 Tax=Micromonospora yangpuensis TaxID=683228 RepID=A0A1C6V2C6_9ACTN|nr:hypothetical protein [Micromonospora yangpuensis]GGL98537.1 hypothetical protein GCM10012279_15050 [Micromonospora yangpuensis]SCL60499.1 hypothetical protein GA0070617_4398 [Micromonospora yangpuensis]
MAPDDNLDEALRELARHARQTGRVATASDVRRRGDTRRRRRYGATAVLGVVLLGAVGVGIAGFAGRPPDTLPAGPTAVPSRSAPLPSLPTPNPARPTPTPTGSAPVDTAPTGGTASGSAPTGAAPATSAGTSASTPAAEVDPLKLARRQYAVVRTGAFESAVSLLDDGQLGEVDGDEGRSLFVFLPQPDGSYLIRTAEPDSAGTRHCWQVGAGGGTPPIVAARCVPTDPAQQFTIGTGPTADGDRTHTIGNGSAFLRHSSQLGLVLAEADAADADTVFRFVDNGAAPR